MFRIVCDDPATPIEVDAHLNGVKPLVVAAPSRTRVSLRLQLGAESRLVCSTLEKSLTLPAYGQDCHAIPPQTYFLLTCDRGMYTAYFCLAESAPVYLEGKGKDLIELSVGGSSGSEPRDRLICTRGEDPYQTIRWGVRLALELAKTPGRLIGDKPPLSAWQKKLGWASGTSFGSGASHEKILNAVWSLRQEGVQLGYVLLDKGWQGSSFDADPTLFPSGLKGFVEDLQHAGISHVGVWHGIGNITGSQGEVFEFYNGYYRFLREQGIGFVKVGEQHAMADDPTLSRSLQVAIQAAGSIHFDSSSLNTDCLRPENLLSWAISSVARTSPMADIQNPIQAKVGIRNGLTTSLWLQHLMHPVFDSWATTMPLSETFATLQTLSGSLNMISDPPGRHDWKLIRKMVLPDGTLLQPDSPLTPCREVLFIDPLEEKQVYKAFTMKGEVGVVGVFNLAKGRRSVAGEVSPNDVEGIAGKHFAAHSHQNGFLGVMGREEKIAITLKPHQSDVITFSPVDQGVAVIGSYLFLLAPGPIQETNIVDDTMSITCQVIAPLILYCERPLLEVRCNGEVVPWELDSERNLLSINSRSAILNTPAHYHITFER